MAPQPYRYYSPSLSGMQPIQRIINPLSRPLIYTFSSPIIMSPQNLQRAPLMPFGGTSNIYPSMPISPSQTVFVQRPQGSMMMPDGVPGRMFQPMPGLRLADPQVVIRTIPSPIIDAPISLEISASASISDTSDTYQPLINNMQRVGYIPQQVVVPAPYAPQAVIKTIYSDILPAPQSVLPTFSAPLRTQVAPMQPNYLMTNPSALSPSQQQVQVSVKVIERTYPSQIMPSPYTVYNQPTLLQRQPNPFLSPSASMQIPMRQFATLPSYLTRSPAGYTCSHNFKITTSIHIQSISVLSNPAALFSSSPNFIRNNPSTALLSNTGCSFASHHYPFHTIVISLKVTVYVQSLSLGSQSNVYRYGLRVYNPERNVDDTYYSSIDPNTGRPMISNIHMAKVAVRLYINLYTTSDGRPPTDIQVQLSVCLDLRSGSSGDERFLGMGGGMPGQRVVMPQQPIMRQPGITAVIRTFSSPIVMSPQRNTYYAALPPSVAGVRVPRPLIYTFSSPIIMSPQNLQRVPLMPFGGTSNIYPSMPISPSQTVFVQQPQGSMMMPDGVPGRMFQPMPGLRLADPQVVIRTIPSPIIDAPINLEISASVSISDTYQPLTNNMQRLGYMPQQVVIPEPSPPQAVIKTIYSDIRPAPLTRVVGSFASPLGTQFVPAQPSISIINRPIPVPISQSSMPGPGPMSVIRTMPSSMLVEPSPIATAQVTIDVVEKTYPSRVLPSPTYIQPIQQPIYVDRRFPSNLAPSISGQMPQPIIRTFSSPIIRYNPVSNNVYISQSIPSQPRIEMCRCQCPSSGSVSMFYNLDQQSCTISGGRRKRRQRYESSDFIE